MPDSPAPGRTVTATALNDFIRAAFEACRLPTADAQRIAGLMVEADLIGADNHGVFRLAQYVRRIKAGGVAVHADIAVIKETDSTALVDGGNAMGHLVMHRATELAIEKAAQRGVAWVGTRNSNHAGPAALYAAMPLKHDMIGLYIAVGNANHMAPWGGIDMLLSTNPIAIAVPTHEEPPVVLDMATSVAAYGKVKGAAQRGEMMPEGWMMDRQGRPITDPKRADEGFVLPIGSYKGYGLALLFGLLAGTLNGAAMGKDVVDFNADDKSATNTGQLIVALRVDAFGPVEAFKRSVDRVVREIRNSARLPGVETIRLPGEQSYAKRQARRAGGIPLHPNLVTQLDKLADQLKIETLPAA
ncbi:MAG: Ldh family oxidoreductase [Proteobacteria bacterium]|nr:Ldh family oxidoreductase [Pseudomonadota bacterium]